MIAWQTVAEVDAPGGGKWSLVRRGEEWAVRAAGRLLMSSRSHGSEEALARVALERAPRAREVLVGGLGLGFTLRATLDRLPPGARVVVAELVPELVAWNRGPLAPLAGRPLEDPRVRVEVGDVLGCLRASAGRLDAVLLDVDNGPAVARTAVGRPANGALYGAAGVRACRDALRPGGVLAVWSAGPAPEYLRTLSASGLLASEQRVGARGHGGGRRDAVLLGIRAAGRDRDRRRG